MSVFNQGPMSFNKNQNFWSTKPQQNSSCFSFPVLFTGLLHIPNSIQTPTINTYINRKYIYFAYDCHSISKAKITWSIIESFIEPENKNYKFGFNIKNHKGSQDFLLESETELEKWLEHFSGLGVLSGFDQDYCVIKNIDIGRFGSVSLCQDIMTANEFAVKMIKKELLNDNMKIKQVKDEIKAMRRINSPVCVKLYRVYEDDENVFLVMEYLPYGNLLQRLMKVRKFEEWEAVLLVRNLFEVIYYFGAIGIVHRDIKLENLLMVSANNNYEIKIVDFGLACRSEKTRSKKCGSPGFIAPEILNGLEYCNKVDVFSAGVVIYALLAGKLPFFSKNMHTALEKNQNCEVIFERQEWKTRSHLAINFIRGVLTRDPASRPTAEEALNHPWINKLTQNTNPGYLSPRLTFTDLKSN